MVLLYLVVSIFVRLSIMLFVQQLLFLAHFVRCWTGPHQISAQFAECEIGVISSSFWCLILVTIDNNIWFWALKYLGVIVSKVNWTWFQHWVEPSKWSLSSGHSQNIYISTWTEHATKPLTPLCFKRMVHRRRKHFWWRGFIFHGKFYLAVWRNIGYLLKRYSFPVINFNSEPNSEQMLLHSRPHLTFTLIYLHVSSSLVPVVARGDRRTLL